jgi:hypothetical protein
MRGLSVPVLELATIAINIGLCVAIMRSAGNRAANPFFLAIGLFAVLMIGRHLMLVSGADVEFPEYLFIQDNSPWRLLAGLGISLWLAGVLVASTFSYRRAPKPYLPSFPHEPASFSALRGVAYVLLLATMALLGTLVMATGEGLDNTSYLLRFDPRFAHLINIKYVVILTAYFLTALAASLRRQQTTSARWQARAWMLAALLLAVSTLLFGDRDLLIFWLLYAFAMRTVVLRGKGILSLLPLAAPLAGLFVLLKALRNTLWFEDHPSGPESVFRSLADGLNMDIFDKLTLAMRTWDQQDLRLGEDFLNGIVALLPRAVWPGKPDTLYVDIWFKNLFEASRTGWPISPPGEWYINFGWPGFALGGLATGMVLGLARDKYRDAASNPFAFMVVFIVATRFIPLGVTSSLPFFYLTWMLQLVLAALLYRALRSFLLRSPSPVRR